MSRRSLFAALATVASAASAQALPDGRAWNCTYTASFSCGPSGCVKVAPPRYVGVLTPGDYWRCPELPFCADQPRATVRRDGDGLIAIVPESGVAVYVRDGRITETVIRQDNTVSSFGNCRQGPAAVITRLAPGKR